MARKTLLDAALIIKIAGYIRAGAYDYIAAEACGIGQRTFYRWLEDAELPDADPLKVEFAEEVEQAKATARLSAEAMVKHEDPAVWLLKGPGRERPGRPGWSNDATLTVHTRDTPIKLTWGEVLDDENPDSNRITATAPGAADGTGE